MRLRLPFVVTALLGGALAAVVATSGTSPTPPTVGDPSPNVRTVLTGVLVLESVVLEPPIRLVATFDHLAANDYIVYETIEGLARTPSDPLTLVSLFAREPADPRMIVAQCHPMVIEEDFNEWLRTIGDALVNGSLVIICGGQRPLVIRADRTEVALEFIRLYRKHIPVTAEMLAECGLTSLAKYAVYFREQRRPKRAR